MSQTSEMADILACRNLNFTVVTPYLGFFCGNRCDFWFFRWWCRVGSRLLPFSRAMFHHLMFFKMALTGEMLIPNMTFKRVFSCERFFTNVTNVRHVINCTYNGVILTTALLRMACLVKNLNLYPHSYRLHVPLTEQLPRYGRGPPEIGRFVLIFHKNQ